MTKKQFALAARKLDPRARVEIDEKAITRADWLAAQGRGVELKAAYDALRAEWKTMKAAGASIDALRTQSQKISAAGRLSAASRKEHRPARYMIGTVENAGGFGMFFVMGCGDTMQDAIAAAENQKKEEATRKQKRTAAAE